LLISSPNRMHKNSQRATNALTSPPVAPSGRRGRVCARACTCTCARDLPLRRGTPSIWVCVVKGFTEGFSDGGEIPLALFGGDYSSAPGCSVRSDPEQFELMLSQSGGVNQVIGIRLGVLGSVRTRRNVLLHVVCRVSVWARLRIAPSVLACVCA